MITIAINIVFFDNGSVHIDSDGVDGGDGLCSYSAFLHAH